MMKLILLIFGLMLLMGTASATNYYVSTTGDNSSNGLTIGTAWKNVSYGVTQLIAGDTLYLIDGTWYNEHVVFSSSGNITHPIIVTAYNGTPILDGVDKSIDHRAFFISSQNYIYISDIKTERYQNAVAWLNATNCSIDNMTMTANWIPGEAGGVSMVQVASAFNITISNCSLYNASWNTITVSGSASYPDANGVTIHNNTFYDNEGHTGGVDMMQDIGNLTITNNTFTNSNAVTYIHLAVNGHTDFNFSNNVVDNCDYITLSDIHDGVVQNNIFNNSLSTCIENSHDAFNITIQDNEFYNMGSHPIKLRGYNITLIDNYIPSDESYRSAVFQMSYTNATMIFTDEYMKEHNNEPMYFMPGSYATVFLQTPDGNVFDYLKVFGGSGMILTLPKWYSTGGSFGVESNDGGSYSYRITPYNITTIPTSSYLNTTVNNYDYVNDLYNLTVSSPTAENPTWINVTVVNASNTYNVSRNGVYYDSVGSGVDSIIRYHYDITGDEWSEYDFEFTWANTSGWSAAENHIYQGRPFEIDTNGDITQLGTPTQYDVDLTGVFGVCCS